MVDKAFSEHVKKTKHHYIDNKKMANAVAEYQHDE
jgi:hypothetical protein